MTVHRRHGLRTLTVRTAARRKGNEQLVTGRRTVVVRPLDVYGPEGHERRGDRLLLLDETGRSVAVALVLDAVRTTLASVVDADWWADDPDCTDRGTWTAEWRREWDTVDARRVDDVPVVCVRFRVVGLEDEESTTSQG